MHVGDGEEEEEDCQSYKEKVEHVRVSVSTNTAPSVEVVAKFEEEEVVAMGGVLVAD
jgi:hypothetical protein